MFCSQIKHWKTHTSVKQKKGGNTKKNGLLRSLSGTHTLIFTGHMDIQTYVQQASGHCIHMYYIVKVSVILYGSA